MAKEKLGKKAGIEEKLDLIIKLLGLQTLQKDIKSKIQQEQIVIMKKRGFSRKEISSVFEIKGQQVDKALSRAKAKK